MKYITTLLCILTGIIIACNSNRSEKILGTPESVRADEYTVTVDRDTTLVTKNGALIKIPKGTLSTGKGNTVVLDIKEAYTIQQMIKYGLHTEADGDPLSSGGMIYINAKAGQNVTINQPIKVALPTTTLQKGMQLYKGVKDEKGNINWKDPSAITPDPRADKFEQGKKLFITRCVSCHRIGEDLVGPNLAHFVKRFITSGWGTGDEANWVMDHGLPSYPYLVKIPESVPADSARHDYDITQQYYEHYDLGYAYKCNLVHKYNSTAPSLRPGVKNGISHTDLDMILRYIQYESNRRDLPLPSHAYLNDCIDSCGRYRETVERLNREKAGLESKKTALEDDNGRMVNERRNPVITTSNDSALPATATVVNFDEVVSPESYGSVYYQFTIESFGWYNVDMLLKEVNGSRESELFVRVTGEYKEKVQVYLIIPEVKVYTQGGLTEKSPDQYVFAYKSGKLYLPQHATGYIMAVTETSETIAYGLKQFTTDTSQQFDISLQRATKEEFNAAISVLNSGDMKISVADSKNAAEIRKTEEELRAVDKKLQDAQLLKPKNCDCDCGMAKDTAATVASK